MSANGDASRSAASREEARIGALLDTRTAALARRAAGQAAPVETRAFLVCACGSERCGLPLASVAGVLPAQPCTPVPGAPAALRGIAAIAGTILSVIDLAHALGLDRIDSEEAGPAGHFVRLRAQDPPVVLAVDRVIGVATVPLGAIAGLSAGSIADPDRSLGADLVSGYAPPGPDAAGADAGFAIIDPSRLLRRYLP